MVKRDSVGGTPGATDWGTMSEFEGFDVAVDRAWSDFQGLLADAIASMREDELLAIELGEESSVEGFVPCVQFLGWGAGQVRCEVPSNSYLDPRHRLSAADEDRMVQLGWHRPTRLPADEPDAGSPAFFVDRPVNWADQLATMTVTVFRELWSVPHPSFLHSDPPGRCDPDPGGSAFASDDPGFPSDLMAAMTAENGAHLADLVAATLSELFDDPVDEDDGGEEFALAIGPLVAFVGPNFDGGEVHIRMPLVRDVSDRTRASELLTDLNRRWPHLKFTLFGDRVDLWAAVLACPFVPQHLIDTLHQVFAFARTVDPVFAARFGGRLDGPVDGPVDDEPDVVEVRRGELRLPPRRQLELFVDPGEQTSFDDPS